MARFVARFETDWSQQQALSYVADFARAEEWDPSVINSKRRDEGQLGEGSSFDLTVRLAGRVLPLRYELVELSDSRAVLRARTKSFESRDTVSVARNGQRTELTYDARIDLLGWRKVFNPLLAVSFGRLATRAEAGLRRVFQ